jgi:hypothetical protein
MDGPISRVESSRLSLARLALRERIALLPLLEEGFDLADHVIAAYTIIGATSRVVARSQPGRVPAQSRCSLPDGLCGPCGPLVLMLRAALLGKAGS